MEQSLSAFAEAFRSLYHIEKTDVRTYPALTLAYIGDGVYELVIRSYLVRRYNRSVNGLHQKSSQLVNAATQSRMIEAIREKLTEDELAAYRRGRNAHAYTKAKHASMSDYRRATGFEALIGYLFLEERYERLTVLIHEGLLQLGLVETPPES